MRSIVANEGTPAGDPLSLLFLHRLGDKAAHLVGGCLLHMASGVGL